MSALRILLVEDNLSFALELEMLIVESGYTMLDSVDNAASALEVLQNDLPDLILLDIGIKGPVSGLELAEKIQDQEIPIIFITQSRDDETYARAQKINPIAYLVKPFDLLTLQSTIINAFRSLADTDDTPEELILPEKLASKGAFFIKNNQRLVKLVVSTIDWIRSEGNYCYIQSGDKKYILKISLAGLLKKLAAFEFVRVHKSYGLPLNKIESIDLFEATILCAGKSFPLGRRYKPEIVKMLDLL